jgi:hypothetical protein
MTAVDESPRSSVKAEHSGRIEHRRNGPVGVGALTIQFALGGGSGRIDDVFSRSCRTRLNAVSWRNLTKPAHASRLARGRPVDRARPHRQRVFAHLSDNTLPAAVHVGHGGSVRPLPCDPRIENPRTRSKPLRDVRAVGGAGGLGGRLDRRVVWVSWPAAPACVGDHRSFAFQIASEDCQPEEEPHSQDRLAGSERCRHFPQPGARNANGEPEEDWEQH